MCIDKAAEAPAQEAYMLGGLNKLLQVKLTLWVMGEEFSNRYS